MRVLTQLRPSNDFQPTLPLMMTRSLHAVLVAVLIAAVALTGTGIGCSTGFGTGDEEVRTEVAHVDSLTVPDEIASSDTLSIHLSGTVGPNGCYSLDRIDEERSPGQLTITPIVHHRTGDDIACTMAIVPLNTTYRAAPPFEEGTLEIVAPQPDRPDVTATVLVN